MEQKSENWRFGFYIKYGLELTFEAGLAISEMVASLFKTKRYL